jgi:prolyl-tRNA synthetase
VAVNSEAMGERALEELGVTADELEEVKTAEVGNIFNFGRQKAEDLGLTFKNEDGENVPVWMGSYGIGVTRLIGVLVEKFADEKGIVWPESVAPFRAHLVGLNLDDEEVRDYADGVYAALLDRGIEVLFDDRDARAGEKFADADLMGMPYRIVVSRKTKDEDAFEVVTRASGETRHLTEEELYADFDIESPERDTE